MTNNRIYGVSSKYDAFREKWGHKVYTFDTMEAAENWLHTEGYDFREREIMKNKTAAVKLAGRTAVDNATYAEKEYKN